LGRALLTSPRLLLLDEPLAGLDAGRRGHLLGALQRLGEALEVPMLLVSHAADEVLALTDDVVVIDGGRVLGQGPFFEVIGAAGVFPLADALGLVNLLPGAVTSTGEGLVEVAVGDGVARAVGRAVAGEAVTLRLRPEDVLVATRPPEGLSARNQLRGRIARIDAVHDRYLATIDLGGGALLRAELTAGAIAELELAEGVVVWAVFKATAVRVG
jgi:molybdate transport system ATP-binding protein